MTDGKYIANPTSVLKAYMSAHEIERDLRWGQLAMGLEVVTLIRTLESIPVVNDAERQGTVACLVTLLREQGLEDVYGIYDTLAEWRRVRFVSERGYGDVASSDERAQWGDSDSSSPRAVADHSPTRRGTTDVRQLERRDLVRDASPKHEQLALPFSGLREKRCE